MTDDRSEHDHELHLTSDDAPFDDRLSDVHIDDMLRAAGADLPEPVPSDAACSRVEAVLGGALPGRASSRRGLLAAVIGLAASVAIMTSLYLAAHLETQRLRGELERLDGPDSPVMFTGSPWEEVEVPPRLIVVNFSDAHSDLGATATEIFERLEADHAGQDVFFLDLDVSGDRWDQAMSVAQVLGLECIIDEAAYLETGMVKVIDCGAGQVLMTITDGARLTEAQALLGAGG